MRPLELLIPILTAFYLAYPLLTGSKHPAWGHFLPMVTLSVTIVHLLIEKYRWQMIPTYVFVVILAIYAGISLLNPSTGQFTRLAWRGAGLLTSILLLGVASTIPALLPVPSLPEPDGQYKVGTTTLVFTDNSRKEIYSGNDEPRKFMVQIWYPAKPAADAQPVGWMQNADIIAPEIAKSFHFPAFFLNHVALAKTSSYLNAMPDLSGGPYPVLVFSHGWTGFRAQNTFQVQELASHGYVVIGMEFPYASQVTVFPDGQIAYNNPSALPSGAPSDEYEAAGRILVNQWVGDLGYMLDQVAILNQFDPNGMLTGMMDMDRIGFFGHSTGGGATLQFCSLDSRCKAGLTMDAFMRPVVFDVLKSGASQPFFFMFSEAWPFERNTELFNRFYSHLAPGNRVVTILGTRHHDFSDMPAFSPLAPQLGLKGPINGALVQKIINTYSLAFFDKTLKGIDSPLFDGPSAEFQDVRFDK